MFDIGDYVQTVDRPHRYGHVIDNYPVFGGQILAGQNGSEIRYYEPEEIEKATLCDRLRGKLEKLAMKFAGVEEHGFD